MINSIEFEVRRKSAFQDFRNTSPMCGGSLLFKTSATRHPCAAEVCFSRLPQHVRGAAETSLYYVEGKWGANRPHFLPPRIQCTAPPTSNRKQTSEDTMTSIVAKLPYPPSVNHYWSLTVARKKSGRAVPIVRVSEDGVRYATAVRKALDSVPTLSGPLLVQIVVNPPDRRTRDLDNVLKCLLDSLTKAGIWQDDSQVEVLVVERGELQPGGSIEMLVRQLDENSK